MAVAEEDMVIHEVKRDGGSSLVMVLVAVAALLILVAFVRRWLR
jgi:hypothetical protein